MSLPTGMSPATGSHYNHVAAQMQQYLNSSNSSGYSGHQLQSAQGRVHQHHPTHGIAYASHMPSHAAQYLGVDPVISQDVGGFARLFMRNLLR
ncbi:unnamed protein product [Adineta steineri]|uniref:Uncharacterized protein n=1 Tax=Adineta steineri TaxID=433720 RepID=A0A816AQ97_9BILA|nr:unnamed protein product [Adineta steineri]CAF1355907.1 unnamed protein product [Adineta steineri]CAF1422324.1 unnamed protein product [Adineta steineri]CAF1598506.1 unnamed protein product [Adineta steineri]